MILCCKCLVVSHFVCSAKTSPSRGWSYSLKTILISLICIASFPASATSIFLPPSFHTTTEPEEFRYLRGRHVSSNFFCLSPFLVYSVLGMLSLMPKHFPSPGGSINFHPSIAKFVLLLSTSVFGN